MFSDENELNIMKQLEEINSNIDRQRLENKYNGIDSLIENESDDSFDILIEETDKLNICLPIYLFDQKYFDRMIEWKNKLDYKFAIYVAMLLSKDSFLIHVLQNELYFVKACSDELIDKLINKKAYTTLISTICCSSKIKFEKESEEKIKSKIGLCGNDYWLDIDEKKELTDDEVKFMATNIYKREDIFEKLTERQIKIFCLELIRVRHVSLFVHYAHSLNQELLDEILKIIYLETDTFVVQQIPMFEFKHIEHCIELSIKNPSDFCLREKLITSLRLFGIMNKKSMDYHCIMIDGGFPHETSYLNVINYRIMPSWVKAKKFAVGLDETNDDVFQNKIYNLAYKVSNAKK